jgi:hypothetical protein
MNRVALKGFGSVGRDRFLDRRGPLSCRKEAAPDARPIALEGRQDLAPDADPRVSAVGVGGVIEGDDPAAAQEVEDLEPPDREQRADKKTLDWRACRACRPGRIPS